MGGGGSKAPSGISTGSSVLYNKSDTTVSASMDSQSGVLPSGGYIIGRMPRRITVQIHDSRGRLVKYVSFQALQEVRSHNCYRDRHCYICHISWIIVRDGVIKCKAESGFNVEDPNGPFYRWSTNNQSLYEQQDKQEAEERERKRVQAAIKKQQEDRARKEEAERLWREAEDKRRTEEHQQLLEDNRRKRQEAEDARIRQEEQDIIDRPLRSSSVGQTLHNEQKDRWKQEHWIAQERQELQEFSEINAKYVPSDGDGVNYDGLQPTWSKTELSPTSQLLIELVQQYYLEETEIDVELAERAELEMIQKIAEGKNIFLKYSSPEIHIQCLQTFQEIVCQQSTPYLVAYLNSFEAIYEEYCDQAAGEKNEEVQYKMNMVSNSLAGHWQLRIKGKTCTEVHNYLFQSPEPPQPYGIHVVYPVRDMFNFPTDPETWSLFSSIVKYNKRMTRAKFIEDFITQETFPKYHEIQPEYRPTFLELLYSITFQTGENFWENKKITTYFQTTAIHLSSLEEEGQDRDMMGEFWVNKYISSLLMHKRYSSIWNPIPHEFLKFWLTTHQRVSKLGISHICINLASLAILSPDVEEIPVQFDGIIMANLLLQDIRRKDGYFHWGEESPDFFVQCFIGRHSRLDANSRDILIECASNLKTTLKISANTLQNLYSWFDDRGLSDLENTSKVLQLCQILLQGQHLIELHWPMAYFREVGRFVEMVISKVISEELDPGDSSLFSEGIATLESLIRNGYRPDKLFETLQLLVNHTAKATSEDKVRIISTLTQLQWIESSADFWDSNFAQLFEMATLAQTGGDVKVLLPALKLFFSVFTEQVSSEPVCTLLTQTLATDLIHYTEEMLDIIQLVLHHFRTRKAQIDPILLLAMGHFLLKILTCKSKDILYNILGWFPYFTSILPNPVDFFLQLHSGTDYDSLSNSPTFPEEFDMRCEILHILAKSQDGFQLIPEVLEAFGFIFKLGFNHKLYKATAELITRIYHLTPIHDRDRLATIMMDVQEIVSQRLEDIIESKDLPSVEYDVLVEVWFLINPTEDHTLKGFTFLKNLSTMSSQLQDILINLPQDGDVTKTLIAIGNHHNHPMQFLQLLLSGCENQKLGPELKTLCLERMSTLLRSPVGWTLIFEENKEQLVNLCDRLVSSDCSELATYVQFCINVANFIQTHEPDSDEIIFLDKESIYFNLLTRKHVEESEQDAFYNNPMELKKTWLFKWVKMDQDHVEALFSALISRHPAHTRRRDFMFSVGCTLAEFWFSQMDFCTGDSVHRRMLSHFFSSPIPEEEELDFDSTLEQVMDVERDDKDKQLLGYLLLHRSLMCAKSGDSFTAKKYLDKIGIIEFPFNIIPGAAGFSSQIGFLQSILHSGVLQGFESEDALESEIRGKLLEMEVFLTDNGIDGKNHTQLICTKLGIDLVSPRGVQYLTFCLKVGEWYDSNIVVIFPPQEWPQQLIRSEMISRLNQLIPKEKWEDDDGLENILLELWDHILLAQNCNPGSEFSSTETMSILEQMHEVVAKVFVPESDNATDWSNSNNATLALLYLLSPIVPNQEESIQSLQDLQKNWLASRFKMDSQDIDLQQIETFFETVSTSEFMGSVPNLLFLDELLRIQDAGTSIQEVVNFIQFLTSCNRPISTLQDVLHPFNPQKEVINLENIQKETESFILSSDIDSLFQEFLAQISEQDDNPVTRRRFYVYSNCKTIFSLLHSSGNWELKELQKLIQLAKSKGEINISAFAQTIHAIYCQTLMKPVEVLELLEDQEPQTWPSLITTSFSSGHTSEDKSVDDLFYEMATNSHIQNLDHIREIMDDVENHIWTQDELKWRPATSGDFTLSQKVSKLSQAISLHKGYPKVRDTQILSLLTLILKNESNGGRLARISTGEGKSVIVAMLAAYIVMEEGRHVDIVTSSPILAERDVEEFQGFYSLLGISVGFLDPVETQLGRGNPKACYSLSVLYGDASSFQGDVLRHEFSLLNTRGNIRTFEAVIIDEVDCMLIDQGGHSTRLVDKMPGMDHLEPVLISIWAYLNSIAGTILELADGRVCAFSDILGTSSTTPWLDVVCCVAGRNIRLEDLKRFAVENELREKSDPTAKEAIGVLLQSGVILLPPDMSENRMKSAESAIASEAELRPDRYPWLIDEVIVHRWKTDTDAQKLRVLEMMLKKKVNIYTPDKEAGIIDLSPQFHDDYPPPSEEFVGEILLLHVNNRFFHLQPISDRTQFIKAEVISKVRDLFVFSTPDYDPLAEDHSKKIKIPHHLSHLYNSKLDKWVESALTAAFRVTENRDYLIKLDSDGHSRVVPIDYESTGVIQEGTVWSDGLHQFLQLKHQLALTPENLATNFLSNMSFFTRYHGHIYGLTGTLGSDPEKQLLSTTYNVDTVDIPTFKVKLHTELRDIITPSTDHWLSAIATSVLIQAKTRAVLVICRSIYEVNRIENYLRQHLNPAEMGRYTRSDYETETQSVAMKFKVGRILLATNLAGRGTDIKLEDEVVTNGGLHVCITFLPTNLRVEHQAAGRAARQGQPGSSQLILNGEVDLNDIYPDLDDFVNPSPENVKQLRDKGELHRIEKIQAETIPPLKEQERAFKAYCVARRENFRDKHELSALDEKWGIMLDTSIPSSFVSNYEGFLGSIPTSGGNISNPYYEILKGNHYNSHTEYNAAIRSFDNAIAADGVFVANAHYYKAYSMINRFDDTYKEDGAKCLNNAASLIGKVIIPTLLAMHQLGTKRNEEGEVREFSELKSKEIVFVKSQDEDSDFTKQVANKISLFQVQLKSIEEGMAKMEEFNTVEAELIGLDDYFEEKGVAVPKAEIDEFKQVGLLGFIKIVKKPPDWTAIFVVILIGVLEVVAGAALAICTGGAFGTGLIADGIGDVVTGIKAAVNGEYISLGDFFKEKAISLAISALASVAGAALSSAAGAIKSFAVNTATKFANTGFGKFAIGIGKTVKDWGVKAFTTVRDWGIKVGTAVKEWAIGIGTSAKNFGSNLGQNIVKFGNNLATTLKLDKAWEYLKKGYNYVSNKIQEGYNKVRAALSPMMAEEQKRQLMMAGKLIGYEVAKTGLLQGFDLILNKAILEPLTEAIKTRLQADMAHSLKIRMQSAENLPTIQQFLSSAKDFDEFNSTWIEFQRIGNHTAASFSTNRSEAAERTFQALSEFASEVKRIMGNESNKMGHRNIIATVVSVSTTVAIEGEKFANLVRLLGLYVPHVNENLKVNLQAASNHNGDDRDEDNEPYCLTRRGRMDTTAAINSVADSMAEIMATKMAGMIESGIINPVLQIGVNQLADIINPFKQSNILDDIERNQTWLGNEGRAQNASIWNVLTNKDPPADLSLNDKKFERKDGQDLDDKRPTLDRRDALKFDNSGQLMGNLARISFNLDSPVQIYSRQLSGGQDGDGLQLSVSVGSGKPFPPLKLCTVDGGLTFCPIVVENGRSSIVPLENNRGSDLLTSAVVGLAMQGSLGRDTLADFVYKMKTCTGLSKGYGFKDMNILRLASFKVD